MKQLFCVCALAFLAWNASAGIMVQFRTSVGDIDVELFDQDKPKTVQNFINYAKVGVYEGSLLHRCLPGFIVQGGGYLIGNSASTAPFAPTNGNLFVIPALYGALTNEFNVGRRLTNSFGTIAMAKVDGDPNSATSQWFFNLANNGPNLDFANGGFTVFGRVVRGTNVLINGFNTRNKNAAYGLVSMTNWWGTTSGFGQAFSDLPVDYAGLVYPTYSDLTYLYDVSFLKVQVQQLTNHTQQITWNSVTNATNYVEFTTNLPPVWKALWTTNGNGGALKFVDTATNAPRRFYRVRANY